MSKTILFEKNSSVASIILESDCFPGVRHIAQVFAKDMELVCGCQPQFIDICEDSLFSTDSGTGIVFATVDNSSALNALADRAHFDLSLLRGKREVFAMFQIEDKLVIAGSDLRGTIYGIFELSRRIGVSPLVYWGDIIPARKEKVVIELHDAFISKEPSILYRGFFINDEWPAFGNWCNDHFGGFTASCYEQVFLLLLRLRGNYMWPAMWSSTFSEDGPGLANAKLADELGIIMGASHHEPMCRAGAEWQHIYSNYGKDNTWSFISNREAITDFWRDGVLRNKDFQNIITIGMRGENDSKLMGENATLADNINVIKDAILTQRKLLTEIFGSDPDKIPQMLAIYKEVEDYYYGNSNTVGLKEWDELKNVIFMLCEDNFGNTRGLPEQSDIEKHPGGYGMYYHFDYHGAPISYEWQNCVRLTKTCDQLTNAYDHGVRKLWIVNVGDVKGVEYPLEYFMDLAYDYEKWSDIDLIDEYVSRFVDEQFGYGISAGQKSELISLIDGYTKWASLRKLEAVNPGTYHPVNYGEAQFVIEECNRYINLANKLHSELADDIRCGFDSIFYYPAVGELNVIRMNAYSALNIYAFENSISDCDIYARAVDSCIAYDRRVVSLYNSQVNGKWKHMMDSAHVWFKTWCDQGWSYPEARYMVRNNGSTVVVNDLEKDDECLSISLPKLISNESEKLEFIGINADQFTESISKEDACYKCVRHLGRMGSAIKAYPQNRYFSEAEAPSVSYRFNCPCACDYDIYITFMARNPVVKGRPMRIRYSINSAEMKVLTIHDEKYFTEWMNKDWNRGVMEGIVERSVTEKLSAGENTITFYAYDPNVIIEKFMIVKSGTVIPQSYLGPRW